MHELAYKILSMIVREDLNTDITSVMETEEEVVLAEAQERL
jgi:hypothetical protein